MSFKTSQTVRVKANGQTGTITTIAKHPSWKAPLVFVRILGESNAYGEGELELVQEPNPTFTAASPIPGVPYTSGPIRQD